MRLPYVQGSKRRSKKQVIAFGGLNYGTETREGEFRDSVALSSSLFPALSQRESRRRLETFSSPTALYAKGELCVVDGTQFWYGDRIVGHVTEGEKQFASIGNRIVIFPDKAYYDVGTGEFGSLEATFTQTGNLMFSASTIVSTGGSFDFLVGDAVEISGCTSQPENNKTAIIRAVADKTLTFYDNTFTAGAELGTVTIARKVPDLELICESNNRLWGVEGHTIYGSALGDPFNFFRYDGLATDSYAVAVGSDGAFTGVVPYASHICFFKEDILHKLYGNKSANYQVVTAQIQGVQAGSAASMKVINETLFYKGRDGVYAYTGAVPELISANFSTVRFGDAVAEGTGEKYYISMARGDQYGLYVFDVLRGLWLKEDDTRVTAFTSLEGKVYFIAGNSVWVMGEGNEDISWRAELTPFTETVNDRKGYSRLSARIDLEEGAWLDVEISRDGGPWRSVHKSHNSRARTVVVPILPQRCDAFSVRFSGKGRCLLRSLVREFYVGSDV